MKKSWIILLGLIISLLSVICISAEVRINEIHAKTTEFVEIYNPNNENLNLSNWQIKDESSTDNIICDNIPNCSLIINNSYFIIIGKNTNINNITSNNIIYFRVSSGEIGSGLNDVGDNITFFNSTFSTGISYTNSQSGKSFQFCSGNWLERSPTPAKENNCSTIQNNPPQNNTQNPVQENDSSQKTLISLNIDWNDDEIINGDEFDIEVNAKNLKNQKYNLKIWIKDNEENVISDRYGEDSSEKEVWKSGNYYIYNLFEGPGDKTETIKLRIRKGFSDFSGDAEICFKLENQKCETIEVLKKEAVVNNNNTEKIKTISKSSESTNFISGEVIKLGGSESKETITNNQKNTNSNVIYDSKNEKIKIYSIIGFAVLCLGLVILVLFNKLK